MVRYGRTDALVLSLGGNGKDINFENLFVLILLTLLFSDRVEISIIVGEFGSLEALAPSNILHFVLWLYSETTWKRRGIDDHLV